MRDAKSVMRRCAELVAGGSEREIVVADAASTLLYSGELESSRPLFEGAVERSRRAGATSDLGYALHMAAQLDWYSGDLEPAYAKALEAVRIVEALDTAQMLDDCLARLATFEAVLGREEDSRRHATRALASALQARRSPQRGRARGALRLLGLTTGDLESAVSQLAPAVAALGRGGHRTPNSDPGRARPRRGIHPARGQAGRRTPSWRASRVTLRRRRSAGLGRQPLRCRGVVAEDDGTALAAFEAARRIAEASAFERARTDLCYGERLRRAGRRREGRLHLSAALEVFEATGAVPFAERARSELRASGLAPRKRDSAVRERLTAQELQIALLVAEGKTNRDVAAILFVSPKTVEFHLTRVYRKLDIRSRTELVRRMLAQGQS